MEERGLNNLTNELQVVAMSDEEETPISFQVGKRHTFINFSMPSLEKRGTEKKLETQQLETIEELGISRGIRPSSRRQQVF